MFVGFYGGSDGVQNIPTELKAEFDDLYVIPSEDSYWKWKNADLCVRQWYKDQGHKLKFDHVHLAEWDMLTLFDLGEHAPEKGSNSVTYCFDYAEAEEIDWFWIRDSYYEWELFKKYFKNEYGFNAFKTCKFGIMGGAYLCVEYLEKLASIYPQSINNDEVRLGCYSKLWNIPLVDNGFKKLGGQYRTADDSIYSKFTEQYLVQGINSGATVLHPVRHFLHF